MKFHNIEKNGLCVYEKISKSTELARGSPHTDAPKWLKPYKQHAGTLGPGISFVTLVTDLLD